MITTFSIILALIVARIVIYPFFSGSSEITFDPIAGTEQAEQFRRSVRLQSDLAHDLATCKLSADDYSELTKQK